MKLGISTWSFLSLDVYSAVRTIGDQGLEYIELWGEVPHAYPGWVDKKKLRDVLSTYDMVVTTHAPFTDLNPASPFHPVKEAVAKTLEQFVDFSAYLGARMVSVHPGSVHNELLIPQSAGNSIHTLRKMVSRADGRLSINVENQTRSFSKYHFPLASTTESLELIIADTEGSKCTLDTGHAHANGQDPSKIAERLGTRMTEVHLSDNSGTSDEHLIPGRGTARLQDFLRLVSARDLLVCLELNPHVYKAEEVLASLGEIRPMISNS